MGTGGVRWEQLLAVQHLRGSPCNLPYLYCLSNSNLKYADRVEEIIW